MKIGWIETSKRRFGGTTYDRMAQNVISEHFDLEIVKTEVKNFTKLKYPKLLYNFYKINGMKDIWIRRFDSVLTMPYDKTAGKNVVLVHHIDNSIQTKPIQIVTSLLEWIFYHNLKKSSDVIVTVSKYWQNHFLGKGYSNVHIIYNAFDIAQFNFSEEEISEFKKRFNLDKNPIIYIGNCQKAKGVVEVYKQLKDLDASIVTSGEEEVKIPAMNLNINYRDYLRLLKASSVVVTMSKFKEGWCRTAHEAMLCKTPVVGSGMGGMEELLKGGKQIICKDFSKLRGNVEYLMEHPEIGEKGYEFAKQFTIDRFKKEWISLVRDITD
jgi:glycosyltransferase involved in cell wall biosynthesis